MKDTVRLFVGFDQREAACYHVFCQSVIELASVPVSFHPLHGPMLNGFDGQQDGSNAFIYSRFLVPRLCNYRGWAIFCDGDMVCLEDIAELWALRDSTKAVMVVKHDYKTKYRRKYVRTPIESNNDDYPRKNWSSVILWNCEHPQNQVLTVELVSKVGGKYLHRFEWLKDDEIGELPQSWNALSLEQDISEASLIHYTLGAPGFLEYAHCDGSEHWHRARRKAMNMIGQ